MEVKTTIPAGSLNDAAPDAEAAAAKADQGLSKPGPDGAIQPTQPPAEAGLLAGKFKSPADLEKAYKELERRLGAQGQQKPEAEQQPENKGEQASPDAKPEAPQGDPKLEAEADALRKALEPVQQRVEQAKADGKVDFDAINAEFAENGGKLSDDTFASLEKAGYPRAMVERYIEGQKALVQRETEVVLGLVGGKDAYGQMLSWAKDNFTAEEVTAFDAAVQSRDFAQVKLAVTGLAARYRAAEGSEPNLLQARGSAPATDTYQSWAQVTKDMNSPEYERDPAFRRKVEERIARSSL